MASRHKKVADSNRKDENFLYIVAYVLEWLSGIVVFAVAKQSEKRLRFHALQAVFLGILATVLSFIPVIGWFLGVLLWLAGIVIGIKAYQGEDINLPILGEYAKKHA